MEVGSKEWIEHRLTVCRVQPANLVKEKSTGYLQQPDGRGFNAAKKQKFMGTLNARFNVGKALQSLGMSRTTLYDAIATDPLFRQHYLECVERNVDDAEELLIQNATTNAMSSAERIFFLKKRRGAVYGDKLEIRTSSGDDPALKALLAKMNEYQFLPKDPNVVRKDLIIDVQEQKNDGQAGS